MDTYGGFTGVFGAIDLLGHKPLALLKGLEGNISHLSKIIL